MKVKDIKWEEWRSCESDRLVGYKCDLGKITVLDRETGFGEFTPVRDTETGYRDKGNRFWLASGMFDIRDFPELNIEDAIEKIKEFANTCTG